MASTESKVKKQKVDPIVSSSWSHIDRKPDIKYEHVCTIGGFTKKMEMKRGSQLLSGKFTIPIGDKTSEWQLMITPNGWKVDHDESKEHIGVFLKKINSTVFPLQAKFNFSLVDKDGLKKVTRQCTQSFDVKNDYYWGVTSLMSHSDLKQTDLLQNDTLTVMCEVTISRGDEDTEVVRSGFNKLLVPGGNEEARASKYVEDMGNIFSGAKFTDVTIVCEGEEFQCHRAILAGRSTVFDAMFTHDMKENQESRVIIDDLGAEACQQMIIFIYSGKVEDETLDIFAAELLAAAEKYNLEVLKEMCEEKLFFGIEVENALDRLVLADLHGASTLRALAIKFIGDNGKKIMDEKGWKEKVKMYPDLMADIIDAVVKK